LQPLKCGHWRKVAEMGTVPLTRDTRRVYTL